MEIILLQDVRGVGKKHDVKSVNSGYARNFLIPRGFARPATGAAKKEITAIKEILDQKEANLIKRLTAIAERMKERTLIFSLKTDDHGSVFGSVTKEMILSALRADGYITKERVDIKISQPLKALGTHEIEVDLKKGITATLTIDVRPQP